MTELHQLADHDPVGAAVWAVQGDATCLPFGSQSFDAVLARSVLALDDELRRTRPDAEFRRGGLRGCGLVYELLDIRHQMSDEDARRSIVMRDNPTAPTWDEAAHDALGKEADDYLRKLSEFRVERPGRTLNAVAYLTATRP